ncbi:hypothetical protein ABID37_003483 [Aquamicrobium terrae]|uniref:Transposase n=1 Tax=Aquamicrobium terrae TaxID=1324945 RepID=A0ABV2N3D2_9HYPH
MSYKLKFLVEADTEWRQCDGNILTQSVGIMNRSHRR